MSLIELKRLRADEFLAAPGFDETAPGSQSAREMVRRVNEGSHWRNHLSEAHQLNHELNQVLPLIATDEYVYASLEYELNRRKDPEHVVLMTDLFDQTRIDALLARHWDGPDASGNPVESKTEDRGRAEQLLKTLYGAQDENWRYERALVTMKRFYLALQAVVVGVLLVSFAWIIVSAGGRVGGLLDQVLLVTLAGALGSTLAATLKHRDAVVRLNDFPAVVVVLVAQALIGATLGLVVWLLLRSGAVRIGGSGTLGWETYSLVAFASGFSEPLSLRLIERFLGAGFGDQTAGLTPPSP